MAYDQFEVVFYTSSIPNFAKGVVSHLDPLKYSAASLYRDSCSSIDGVFHKTLDILNRDLDSVIILDSNPAIYAEYPDNAIPIEPWFGNARDQELFNLIPILESLTKVKNV